MKNLCIAVAASILAGCAATSGLLRMVADGKAYAGTYDKRTSSMDVNIDGRLYKGTYVLDSTRSVGSGFATNGQSTASAFGGGSTTSSNARAVLVSADNQVLRCQFAAGKNEAVGSCVDAGGKAYDLVAGQ